jgi:hypothetical protein
MFYFKCEDKYVIRIYVRPTKLMHYKIPKLNVLIAVLLKIEGLWIWDEYIFDLLHHEGYSYMFRP